MFCRSALNLEGRCVEPFWCCLARRRPWTRQAASNPLASPYPHRSSSPLHLLVESHLSHDHPKSPLWPMYRPPTYYLSKGCGLVSHLSCLGSSLYANFEACLGSDSDSIIFRLVFNLLSHTPPLLSPFCPSIIPSPHPKHSSFLPLLFSADPGVSV
ncbi:hypothetical protein B0J13DRAFT_264581 [Dactylonectria estremocensis]|uniref:Uncharacterized protein n=1 Tax=Dactylonectria estremocensis TaxID=1079267 RepID=A0A9P9F4E2_9HYPO|nr:hypothetical protein B0J13DRAFT_264581 [Dactylonectria estremocensis]